MKIHDQLDASWVAFCRISVAYLNFFWISWDIQNILINLIARYFYAKYQWHIWALFLDIFKLWKTPWSIRCKQAALCRISVAYFKNILEILDPIYLSISSRKFRLIKCKHDSFEQNISCTFWALAGQMLRNWELKKLLKTKTSAFADKT